MCHVLINDKLPSSFINVFKLNPEIQSTYITRQSNMFYMPLTKSRFVDKLPLFHFPSIWNNHKEQFSQNESRNQMKKSFKSSRLHQYISVVECDNPNCKDCRNSISEIKSCL